MPQFKSLLGGMQVMGSFKNAFSAVEWPKNVLEYLGLLNFINLDVRWGWRLCGWGGGRLGLETVRSLTQQRCGSALSPPVAATAVRVCVQPLRVPAQLLRRPPVRHPGAAPHPPRHRHRVLHQVVREWCLRPLPTTTTTNTASRVGPATPHAPAMPCRRRALAVEAAKDDGNRELSDKMFRRGYRYMLYTTFIVYPAVSAKVFKTFPVRSGVSVAVPSLRTCLRTCLSQCADLVGDACWGGRQCTEFEDGSSWLDADLSISCLDPDRWLWVSYGTVMVLVYPVGVLAWYTEALYTRRHALNPPRPKGVEPRVWRSRVIHAIRPKDRSLRPISFLYGSCTCAVRSRGWCHRVP